MINLDRYELSVYPKITDNYAPLEYFNIKALRKKFVEKHRLFNGDEMLAVIDEKTKGNLSAEEATMMEQVLHELRMAFVAVSKQSGGAPHVVTPGEG